LIVDERMGAISAVRTKDEVNAIPLLIKLIAAQGHRGTDVFVVATSSESLITSNRQEIAELQRSNSAIAYNSIRSPPGCALDPVVLKEHSAVIECDYLDLDKSMYGLSEYLATEAPERSLARLVSNVDGQYSIAFLSGGEIFAARDPVGLKPLYYYSDSELAVISTERKGIWSLGIRDARTFPPGHVWRLGRQHPRSIKQITPQKISGRNADHISEDLGQLLKKSVAERASGLGEVAVSFSGGLDSSIIAHLLSGLDIKLRATIVGVDGHPAFEWAQNAAELLGLDAEVREYTLEDVEDAIKMCIFRVEESNPVKVGVAIPLCWSASLAREIGTRRVFTGQGADELFGGYHRYLHALAEGGREALHNAIFESVRDAHEVSYQMVEQATAPEGVTMLHPFTDWDLIMLGLSIPDSLKIQSPEDSLRKLILRKASADLGLPKKIAEAPKKAIQYSTGIDKCIKKLARCRGLKTEDYLKTIFKEEFAGIQLY